MTRAGTMGHTGPVIQDAHYPGRTAATPVSRGAWRLAGSLPLLLLLACAGTPPRPQPPASAARVDATPADPTQANNVLMRALGLVGTPYRWGGNTPESGFDCSGLVGFVFRDAAGVLLPRSSRELAAVAAREPSRDRLAAGDLVLFGADGGVSHVGIYVGQGRFVHAPNQGGTVRLDELDAPYWRDNYRGAKRLLY